ncbi:lipopolysaccharide assembly protein LapA domain-containing protein [Jiangella sp. DSM 45060]|uniref:lipopolysaccharide assembly protein LapA domain-containing protein n=1 Tax=Jiangella sp. DSM 45060 TaxID=1798224 RepID=UPI0012FE71EB|nr:lipopolysaccharide assembly protein LapA domain-containing protein [Jiangella sp. DSM 45060]
MRRGVRLAILMVFILQNTGRVDVTFLWLEGSVPLALALLIAAASAGFVVAVIGSVRIIRLRRQLSRRPG